MNILLKSFLNGIIYNRGIIFNLQIFSKLIYILCMKLENQIITIRKPFFLNYTFVEILFKNNLILKSLKINRLISIVHVLFFSFFFEDPGCCQWWFG